MSERTYADGVLIGERDDEAREVRWLEAGGWRSRPYDGTEAAPLDRLDADAARCRAHTGLLFAALLAIQVDLDYLTIDAPTPAQAQAQVGQLTRQMVTTLRLVTGRRDPVTPPVAVVADGAHNAFPGAARTTRGLVVVYRAAVDHATTNGVVKAQRSTDGGATWGAAVTVAALPGADLRDPMLTSTTSGLLMTTFEYNVATQESPSLRLWRSSDDGATFTAQSTVRGIFTGKHGSSGPIVAVNGGVLLWPTYGNDGGPLNVTKVLASFDGGITWAVRAVLASPSTQLEEPNIAVLPDGSLLMMMRGDGAARIFSSTSVDYGSTWSQPVPAFAGSGRPAVVAHDGDLYCVYRAPVGARTVYRASPDGGRSWSPQMSFAPSPVTYVYGQWIDLGQSAPSVVWADQSALTDADVHFQRVPFPPGSP